MVSNVYDSIFYLKMGSNSVEAQFHLWKKSFIRTKPGSIKNSDKSTYTTHTCIWKPTICLVFIFRKGGLTKDTPVDLVLSCVDNFEARMAINTVSSDCVYIYTCIIM